MTPMTLSRRAFLKCTASSTFALAVASPLQAASESTAPAFASPADLAPATKTGQGLAFIERFEGTLGAEYLEYLTQHWLQHMEVNFTGGGTVPDVFYALGCETRPNAPFNGKNIRVPAYVDMTKNESGQPIVGPTLNMMRGETTGVLLSNAIQGCGADAIPGVKDNVSGWKPHDFTSTNLHTHGLHVSPQAPSDDVLIILDSKNKPHAAHAGHANHNGGHSAHHTLRSELDATSYAYRYELPGDHPVGTFWYHPHKHGSVAAQVGPGMAGALIVTAPEAEKDFDTLLATTCNITTADEEIVVLQNISYFETTGGTGKGAFYPYGYYVGKVEDNFDASTCDGLTPTSAAAVPAIGVNGQVNPAITMDQGEIKRLRFVNASNGQTIVPQFVGHGAPEVYAIAVDGIALLPPTDAEASDKEYFKIDYSTPKSDAATYWTTAELITLAPGQRLDLLVKAGTVAGSFQLKGAAKGTVPMVVEGQNPNTADILTVTVTENTSTKNQSIPTISLFSEQTIKRPVEPAFAIDETWPAATQSIEFKTIEENFTESYPSKPAFVVNDQYFDVTVGDPAQIQLFKGDTDVWNVYSTNDAHIFHIHINSFQALGRSVYDKDNRVYNPPVTYKMPIWRDTIYVDSIGGDTKPGSSPKTKYDTYTPGTMVTMASKQVDFTGEFVLHCHNLFHEDNGMMLTVSILDPETGGTDDA